MRFSKCLRLSAVLPARLVTVFLIVGGAAATQAATNGFIVPVFRGATNTQLGYWEIFKVASGSPGNQADQPGATTAAVLTQTDTNAFLTGSGNIYNLQTSAFKLTDTTPFPLGTVVLQTRSVGTELDYSSVSLTYSNASGTHIVAPLFRQELNRASGQGVSVSSLWQWDLTGLGVTNYSVAFAAAGPSLSFDSLTLDTAGTFSPASPAQPFRLKSVAANLARWMYPFNSDPGGRPTASVFGALGSHPDFDSRDAQYLLGWNTTNLIAAGQGARNYLIKRARVTLTIAGNNQYAYTGTLRDYRSYFPTNDSRYVPAASASSPVELFGAGFRGGYTAATYPQAGPWGVSPNAFYSNRVAYAAGFDRHGALIDVSNNVADDGTNEVSNAFEVAPFAVGQTTNVAPGELMPTGSQLTFDLNLDDPLIYAYVQAALNDGNLRLMASSFTSASFTGAPSYPSFYTSFSPLASASQYPLIDIDGAVIRPAVDSDNDGLPDDWENFHFGSLAGTASDDVDGDGATSLAEYGAGTIPGSGASRFRLLSVQRQSAASELQFSLAPGRQYSVSWSDDLTGWQTITNPALVYSSAWLAKTGTNLSYPAPVFGVWRDTNSNSAHRFYRLQAD